MSVDYRATVFLPQADHFPMRARLPKREPQTLATWDEMDLYGKLRAQSAGRDKFVLHDGPPYANGHLHMGHALNKILKDVINRAMQMRGYDANYVPGWDCHGLPIEWKVEEGYRAEGRSKDDVPVTEFRRECREFAERWMATQIEEFKRFGVEGDWDHPYATMSYQAEAQIVREIGKFLVSGGLYAGTRPVLWSVAEKTALADAEVEYHDHTSPTIWVRFPVIKAPTEELCGANIVIWTTTPWTLPGNRALACHPDISYSVIRVDETYEDSLAEFGERLVVATDLLSSFVGEVGIKHYVEIAAIDGKKLSEDVVCNHPLREAGFWVRSPVLPADFVTLDQGTGIVHIAPGHGTDDWLLGKQHGLDIPETVDENGVFLEHVPLFAGEQVYTPKGKEGGANRAVIDKLREVGALLHRGTLRHTYPHSWRSKVPLIFRVTPQWFISMGKNALRHKALAAIRNTKFYPPDGKQRLYDMIANRPDWCVSRQRRWGVPLPIFVHKQTGEPLRDPDVIERIATVFEAEGGDAWFDSDPQRFLGEAYDAADYTQVQDVVEVWFDSGSTHSFVLEQRDDLKWPATLYLEGTDQHRGWFHTSLLEASGTRGEAPYEGVLTHGFVLDGKGHKMSKSMGNVISPQDIMNEKGADILRLWVVAADYAGDVRISDEILGFHADAYRRMRNTLRFLIGTLHDFDPSERVDPAEMPELEQWALHRMAETAQVIETGAQGYDFTTIYHHLYQLCAVDLSAFYFDVRKDALYCDRPDSLRRRACRTVLDRLFHALTAWLAPILAFTAEEAWWAHGAGPEESVHLRQFPEIPAGWRQDALAAKWHKVRQVRRAVTGALEVERAEKRIGAGLQAHPVVHIADDALAEAVADVDLAEICITSGVTVTREAAPAEAFTTDDAPGVAVVVRLAEGEKCQRCWQVRPDVGSDPRAPETCSRCADAVTHLGMAAA
ncbi:Isoleucyl-tRNA synthetase [Limimonas halophila]|uniref:Isoleucine--tRNA ligase n=1 Tax=Limimonas halophila TaxID=1082479 RepID=A0A1G7V8K0_9PROT|nr:isoleucine--tRNA ligase [Limimonas halophila]SDG55851.1 Isoleucyl-tRNA synthetase [Limimonas halophila]